MPTATNCLTCRDPRRAHVRLPAHSDLLTRFLTRAQFGEHVEHEHEGWIGCFNFLIYVTSLIRFILKPLIAADASAPDTNTEAGAAGLCEPCELRDEDASGMGGTAVQLSLIHI